MSGRSPTALVTAALLSSLLASAATALADPDATRQTGQVVRTSEAVTLRAAPGEKQKPVAQLAAGTAVVLLGHEGRWLRVRANRTVGWLARTTVTEPAPAATATTATPHWGAGHFNDAVADVRAGQPEVAPPGSPGASATTASSQASPTAGEAPATGGDAQVSQSATPAASSRLALTLGAALGYRSLEMTFQSNGDHGLDNYVVSTDAMAAEARATAVTRTRSGRFALAADGRARLSHATPGISYQGSAGQGDIAFSVVEAELGVRAGMRAAPWLDFWLRSGYHYEVFVSREVANVAHLPRERLTGFRTGARVNLRPPQVGATVTVTVDWLLLASRSQTPGLEDGTGNTAHARWVGLGFSRPLGSRWILSAWYVNGHSETHWRGQSSRQPDVTAAQRVDTSQLVSLGLGARF